jgi:chemotaxis protein CheC
MEQSALGEVANITGSFFLSALSDATSLFMQPSPPALIMDMIGAALDVPLAELALSAHDALIIDTLFISDESRIKGIFLVLPDTGSTRLFVERLSGQDG